MLKRFCTSTLRLIGKKLLFLVFIIVSLEISLGQNHPIVDSLLNEVSKMKDDTSTVNDFNEQALQYRIARDYQMAIHYSNAALSLAKKIIFKKGEANAYNNLGNIYSTKDNYPEALKYYSTSLKIREEIEDKRGIANSYNNIGLIYYNQGNYPEALKNHSACLKIREEIGDKSRIADCYTNIGNIHNARGNYPEALKCHFTSRKLSEEIGDKRKISAACGNIGNVYNLQGNLEEALKNYLVALKIKEDIGDKAGIAIWSSNIGLIYEQLGNYDEALKSYFVSLKIDEELENKMGIATNYHNIGMIYITKDNFSEALKYYLAAMKINEEIGNKTAIVFNYLNLGNLNMHLCAFTEAKKYFDDALIQAKELGMKSEIMSVYKNLTYIDSIMGNHIQALNHYKLYTEYKDSLFNEANSKMLAQLQTSYETEKKDKEIQKLESEKLISNLELKAHQESLIRINLEKEKILTENLFNLQQVDLLANEKRLQQLEIEKNQIELSMQKAETENKEGQVVLLNKEGEIQKLEIKKQTLLKNSMLAGLGVIFFLGFFIYNNHITRQKLKLQTLRNKIATDLHDDVGSTLSSISIFSEMARQQSKEVIPMLDTIGDSSRKMLDAMADIVWTIQPENDQFDKIILRMRNFAFDLLGAKDIDFEFEADDQISQLKLPMDVRKNLYLIFKEATNNMVKYSEATAAMFQIKNEKGYLTMLIRDNGKGFNPKLNTQGNGLKNMKKRAEEIGGALVIDSMQGSGTTIQLKVAV